MSVSVDRLIPEERTTRVARALGVVAVARNCSVGEALTVLADRAEREQRTLDDVAMAVLRGDLDGREL